MKNLAGKEVEEENLDKGEGQRWPTRDFFHDETKEHLTDSTNF